jgi:hypothetical protein
MFSWYANDAIVRQRRADLTADADCSRVRRTTPRRSRRYNHRVI